VLREPLQPRQRVRHEHTRGALDSCDVVRQQGASGAGLDRRARKVMTIDALTGQRDEQVARLRTTRVDHRARERRLRPEDIEQ